MTLLLDTQLLLWASILPHLLSSAAFALMSDPRNDLLFSAASIRKVAIKTSRGRDDFDVDARLRRRGLLDGGYTELPITSQHAVTIDSLPALHDDPFDRMLLAQAISEGILLLTTDEQLAQYPGPVRKV
ncbi:MAG: type II toxin-antitoxin system VapC family toxin [Chloroflexota bacterium]